MVSRQSPPTDRVVAVLDFMVARRGERFGLSELARGVGLAKPTCLGIVTALTRGGYLVHDAVTKAYGLGPALIAAGRAAQNDFTASALARPELVELSARYDTVCAASAVVGEQIMVLERTGPTRAAATIKVGQTYPFAPPVGLMYVLWGGDRALDEWLARPPTLPSRIDRAHLRQVVDECRERGYLVESLSPAGLRLHSLMAGVAAYDLPAQVRDLVGEMVSSLGERVYLGADLATRRRHPVSLIAAPTFDADGAQELVLTLYVGGALTGAEIARRGNALAAAADAVTEQVSGRRPTGWR
ncbi:helix-turn-helix domain-containing protein [Kutzneria buriramensis]|uniref:DNA-binding IclR family transcriptional regulator n=1 Tax=Kutzneria buriramensis TaxID=1045776 RepID=A0A3E0HIB5_9PSEU|nr:DNA-binding IclR family transcriptional regulator [Kutzneria buriramensis]